MGNLFTKNILITGGAGFIGSNLINHFVNKYPNYRIVNLDLLTYAGNLSNLISVEDAPNYFFVKGDIKNIDFVETVFEKYNIDNIIHLAAESHVDRSIHTPIKFMETNVLGTAVLLETARKMWVRYNDKLFYHISTDEVFGSLKPNMFFNENTPYSPQSPYSASKASADHLVRAYFNTYNKFPILISNCSNNYGPYQFPEKLIPLVINNILNKKKLPIYGRGENQRDWLFVNDHVVAIDLLFHKGRKGETYCIGGGNIIDNLSLVKCLCDITDEYTKQTIGNSQELIEFVFDRPGHDKRYAIDFSKIKNELGWSPKICLKEGLKKTVEWYIKHRTWMEKVINGEYLEYYQKQYNNKNG